MLPKILDNKQAEIEGLDEARLRREAEAAPWPRPFLPVLAGQAAGGPVRLIAELKRASPSRGTLAAHLDLNELARAYAANGAAAISVLTDARYFWGSLETLQAVRRELPEGPPLLRKDFILAPAQVYETRAAGADAALLIAAALPDDARLADLHALALEVGLTPLVEVHAPGEVERALRLPGLQLVGINNRDLVTFDVGLETTARLRPLIPPGPRVVSESGIFTGADVARMAALGVDAVLVGEALVTARDIAAKVRELSQTTHAHQDLRAHQPG